MNFETLKFGLGAIVVVVVLWQALKYLGRFLTWVERSEIARQAAEAAAGPARPAPRASAPPANDEGIPAEHVAAIAAAIAALGEGLKVIHLSDPATGHAWSAEGRWMHQTSHASAHRPH